MKKIPILIPVFTLLLILSSCKKNFLDKAPGVDLTEDAAFASKVNLEQFMATIYRYGMHSIFRYRNQADLPFSNLGASGNTDCIHPSTSISDEGDASEANFVNNNRWNEGNVLPSNIVAIEDFRYYIRWIAMRQIALVLKRANEVPDADDQYKAQVIAEVKFLRALNYFEMIKRYGGVPIVTEAFPPGVKIDVPRNTFDECIKFILKDLQEAIPVLPPSFSASLSGRATAMAAMTLKAKVLLFAASPQYNTATPILSMPNTADNKLICYGNYDKNRWTLAADAAKEALEFAAINGYALVDVPANRNPRDLDNGTVGPLGNYRESWENINNPELIMKYQGFNTTNVGNAPVTFFNPKSFGSSWSGITVPLNFLSKYEDTLGNVVTWGAGGGTDLITKYRSLDPRFKQSMTYTNAYHSSIDQIAQMYNGGKDYVNCPGGIWYRKYLPRSFRGPSFVLNDPLFRLNELYLYYAEALNEASGPGSRTAVTDLATGTLPAVPTSAYDATNKIRLRSKMQLLPAGLTQDQFRLRLRNEIAIELYGDDHRFWDLKRWLLAGDVLNGVYLGLQINRVGVSPNFTYTWLPSPFETRTFNQNMYLHPFPQAEVLKGGLTQNPGY